MNLFWLALGIVLGMVAEAFTGAMQKLIEKAKGKLMPQDPNPPSPPPPPPPPPAPAPAPSPDGGGGPGPLEK